MAHEHHHSNSTEYYTEQILTLGIALAIAYVCLMLWWPVKNADGAVGNQLALILHPKFHLWVFLGSIALFGLVIIRTIALWKIAGNTGQNGGSHNHSHDGCGHEHGDHHHGPMDSHSHGEGHHHHDCGHDHSHEDCDHDHGHHHPHEKKVAHANREGHNHHHHHDCEHDHAHEGCGHDHIHNHDCGHNHGWAPWRYIVLMLPIVLFFLNLPNEVFSNIKAVDLEQFSEVKTVEAKGVDFNVGFLQLEMAAMNQESRNHYEGKTVRLSGKYRGDEEKRFTLARFKINCCAADAVPLNAVIMVAQGTSDKLQWKKFDNQWVQVTGRVHFLQRKDTNEYLTALVLYPDPEHKLNGDLVKVVPRDPNPYAN